MAQLIEVINFTKECSLLTLFPGFPEVTELDGAEVRREHQDVLQFDISVHQLFGVKKLQSRTQLTGNLKMQQSKVPVNNKNTIYVIPVE